MKLKIILVDSKELVDLTLGYRQIYLIDRNSKIKGGDWCIDMEVNKIMKAKWDSPHNYSKIMCSTDNSLVIEEADNSERDAEIDYRGSSCIDEEFDIVLPQLSEQAVELLVDYHNKNGKMPDEVEVEIEPKCIKCDSETKPLLNNRSKCRNCGYEFHLSQGTVDITIPEDKVYTKKEVESLCRNAIAIGERNEGCTALYIHPDEWIKGNL